MPWIGLVAGVAYYTRLILILRQAPIFAPKTNTVPG